MAGLSMAHHAVTSEELGRSINMAGEKLKEPVSLPFPSLPFLKVESDTPIIAVKGMGDRPDGIIIFADAALHSHRNGAHVMRLNLRRVQAEFQANQKVTRGGTWQKAEMNQFENVADQIVT